ncbi:MAG: hydroxyphenylacetyl-CoA thioesterase PaaI [Marmoricola sp.]
MVTGPEAQAGAAAENARIMLENDAASRMLGIELREVEDGFAVATMLVRADMVNGWGSCHGALVAAVADTAFAVACNSAGEVTVASGFDISFLAPSHEGDRLIATAQRRSTAGRSGIYDVSVCRFDDARGKTTVAEFRGRSRSLGKPVTSGGQV